MEPNPYEPPREQSLVPEPSLPDARKGILIVPRVLTFGTAGLITALAANHAVHGRGCWGLQPGGRLSAMIYDLQIMACLIGVVWLAIAVARRKVPLQIIQLASIVMFAVAAIYLYQVYGWGIHTSAHNMGSENLFAYIPVAACTFLIGRYAWR